MSLSRWIFIVLALATGIALGLYYGWVVDPADFSNVSPEALRHDYQADYVLMTAEAYRAEQDPGMAARRLAIFGSKSPSAIAADGLSYARQNGFSAADLAVMQELVTAMQAWSGIR